MSEHDDPIREALAAERAAAYAGLDPEDFEECIAATDAALAARPVLAVRGEEELAKGLATLKGHGWAWDGDNVDRHHAIRKREEYLEIVTHLIANGTITVAPSLEAASREALIEALESHRYRATRGLNAGCECGWKGLTINSAEDFREHLTDALLAGPVQVADRTVSEHTMSESTEPREGWQAEASRSQRKWHFIVGTESLCGKFGFYFGEVAEGGMTLSDRTDDCAECKRRVARELARRESSDSDRKPGDSR